MAVESWSAAQRRADDRNFVHYVTTGRGRGFLRLRKRFTQSTSLIIAAFLAWYGAYVLMTAFARNVMDLRVAGNVNLGLVLGLLQFASTFLLAWLRARYSRTSLDPLAERIRLEIEGPNTREIEGGRS